MLPLHQKVCTACEGGTPPLTETAIQPLLSQLNHWQTDHQKIWRDFSFTDFKSAIEFINQVANLAEMENHHPDINLHDYKKVTITLSTHAIGGLSENDFILASKIDRL